MGFSSAEIAAMHRSGFLSAGSSSPRDVEVAVFDTLYEMWRAGLRAEPSEAVAEPAPPDENDQSRQALLQRLARVQGERAPT